MRMYDLIAKKKQGEHLTEEEIHFMIRGFVSGEIPDYQMSAMLMAIYFQGMNEDEMTYLTVRDGYIRRHGRSVSHRRHQGR